MDDSERIHPDEKNGLASKYPTLDAILRQVRQIQDERRLLLAKADALLKKEQELDERFHREAVLVVPSVSKKLPDRKAKSSTNALVSEILKNLEQNKPGLEEQLEALLNRFTVNTKD